MIVARIRTIKPAFWRSPDVMSLDGSFPKLLYIGLWNFSDDDGRGLYDPTSIAADILLGEYASDPAGVIRAIDEAFKSYVERGMVTLYEAGGRLYYQINAWHDHQRINRPVPSKIPGPDQDESSIHGGLTESSMSPHGSVGDDSRKERGALNDECMREEEGRGNVNTHGGLTESSMSPHGVESAPAPEPESLNELADRYFKKEKAPGVYGTAEDPRCADHVDLDAGAVPNCRRCARAREWFEANGEDEKKRARAARRAAIDACDLCDDNGKREVPGGLARCDHNPTSGDTPPWEAAQ